MKYVVRRPQYVVRIIVPQVRGLVRELVARHVAVPANSAKQAVEFAWRTSSARGAIDVFVSGRTI
jgi:hypothetical protein